MRFYILSEHLYIDIYIFGMHFFQCDTQGNVERDARTDAACSRRFLKACEAVSRDDTVIK